MLKRLVSLYRRYTWEPIKYAKFIGVKIGKDCLISTKNFPSEAYLIEIGNFVRIAKNVSFFTHGGLWSQRKKTPGLDYFGKIKIGDYTYIGEGALIMPGVNIGKDVIIGAGSVVTKSIPDGFIVAGNPIRIVGKTEEFVNKIKEISFPTYKMNFKEKQEFLLSADEAMFIRKPVIK